MDPLVIEYGDKCKFPEVVLVVIRKGNVRDQSACIDPPPLDC